jgi:hypothetical protein
MSVVYGDLLILTEDDDGKLFVVRVINSSEERVARYHVRHLAGFKLKFPCFADPDHPEDYQLWLHEGWGGQAVRRVSVSPKKNPSGLSPTEGL